MVCIKLKWAKFGPLSPYASPGSENDSIVRDSINKSYITSNSHSAWDNSSSRRHVSEPTRNPVYIHIMYVFITHPCFRSFH